MKMMLYPRFGAAARMIGARRACILFHVWMFPSPSGSWWTATQTGPLTDFIDFASFLAHASPLPLAMADQEYGALKLIHGTRFLAASALAVLTAEAIARSPVGAVHAQGLADGLLPRANVGVGAVGTTHIGARSSGYHGR